MELDKTLTNDFSNFGKRELLLAEILIKSAREQGFPADFTLNRVEIIYNLNSGYVRFTNKDFQVAMMNGNKLESFYSCPECGREGFWEEVFEHSDDINCMEWLKSYHPDNFEKSEDN